MATPNANPLRTGLVEDRLPEPCTVVIFGASGDLTKRKLVPALTSLAVERLLPPAFAIVGFARKPMTNEAFRADMKENVNKFARHRPVDEALWAEIESGLHYHEGNYDDPASYKALKERLDAIDKERGLPGNRVFYLSTPPETFPIAIKQLGAAGLINESESGPFTRVIIEKPFGINLESARSLNHTVLDVLREDQTYRIDHYLGKETVQNLMVMRFANALYEPLWNNRFVEQVQITGAESIGIEGRGGYFDHAGILRDMVQNHLFQVLCLTGMEPPVNLSATDLRDEKVKLLKAIRPIPQDKIDDYVVRAQYTQGSVSGKAQIGYQDETGVTKGSVTDTYVALKIYIDNWRWGGVPFYLRAGKAMSKKVTEVALMFRKTPHSIFGDKTMDEPNVLAIRIQPDEGIILRFGSKVPGNTLDIQPVNMEFRYGTSFGTEPPEAYERLLLDCMLGDPSLYTRGDEVDASWRFITPIHKAWEASGLKKIPTYEAGEWGPAEADALLAKDGHAWRKP